MGGMLNGQSEHTDSLCWIVHVEVRLKSTSTTPFDTIRDAVHQYIEHQEQIILPSNPTDWQHELLLKTNIDRLAFTESGCPHTPIHPSMGLFEIHVYQPLIQDSFEDISTGTNGEEDLVSASITELPCKAWEGLWDSLVYAHDIKNKLLDYVYSTMLLSDVGVDSHVVSWNRLALLHGPPGTGKTSLSRALAQKLAIRLSKRYPQSRILEINSHSLFSRWFSESGKLVQRLFSGVTEMIEDEDTFVVVLIDEVESLTAARASAMAGNEPSDALRVVNALLTQLDKLKRHKNVLVLATSNLPKAIDTAFIDRADIVQFIDYPPQEALYTILASCLSELMRRGIVKSIPVPTAQQALLTLAQQGVLGDVDSAKGETAVKRRSEIIANKIWNMSGRCQGMSGRTLRRLPVLVQARCLNSGLTRPSNSAKPKHAIGSGQKTLLHDILDPEAWLDALDSVIDHELSSRELSLGTLKSIL